jgi:riboflavin synthase
MFTGLVEDIGRVAAVDRTAAGTRLRIASALSAELKDGDSIAVNGVCLTATAAGEETFDADVMSETLGRSSLADAREGAAVNLELPLRATDRLGGHVVQGHVDAVGTVVEAIEEGFARRVWIEAPPETVRYVIEKGSIAVDGVSLTVAEVADDRFAVSLIPETLERTTLGGAAPGAVVNLEVDVLAKYVEKLMPAGVGGR